MVKNVFFVSLVAFVGLMSGLLSPVAAEPQSAKTTSVVAAKKVQHAAPAASDTVVKAERLIPSANLSYKVAGKRYYPLKKVAFFEESGKASWYGNQFHGRKTSSGERYDMNAMTAAHPTLPIPSYAKVTNLKNGKEVIVRINDRGPFSSSRVMDLSLAAAKKLDFVNQGVARVKVEQLLPGKVTEPTPSIYVTLNSFSSVADAQGFMKTTQLELEKIAKNKAVPYQLSMIREGQDYVVKVGPFKKQDNAAVVKNSLLTAL